MLRTYLVHSGLDQVKFNNKLNSILKNKNRKSVRLILSVFLCYGLTVRKETVLELDDRIIYEIFKVYLHLPQKKFFG